MTMPLLEFSISRFQLLNRSRFSSAYVLYQSWRISSALSFSMSFCARRSSIRLCCRLIVWCRCERENGTVRRWRRRRAGGAHDVVSSSVEDEDEEVGVSWRRRRLKMLVGLAREGK